MALIHCRECGREVSDQAPLCPGCGYPLVMGGIAIGIYAVGGLAIGAHTFFNDPHMGQALRGMFHF